MTLTPDEINRILAALQESAWDEAVVEIGEVRIAVARNGGSVPPANAIAPKSSSASESQPAPNLSSTAKPQKSQPTSDLHDGTVVSAPSVGIFWRSPEPGASPFVEIGTEVNQGDILCIVEVMKLMMNVKSPVSGIITAIHAQNGEAVEFGTPLFSISEK